MEDTADSNAVQDIDDSRAAALVELEVSQEAERCWDSPDAKHQVKPHSAV